MNQINLAEIRVALVLASDALEIAEGYCPHVQIDPPRAWKLPGGDESARDGWCTTSSLARKLSKLAKTIDLGIEESPPAESVVKGSSGKTRLELMDPAQTPHMSESLLHSAQTAVPYQAAGNTWARLAHLQGGLITCVKCPHAGVVGVEKVDGKWHWVIEEGASDGHAR